MKTQNNYKPYLEVGASSSQNNFVDVEQLIADFQNDVRQHVMRSHGKQHLLTIIALCEINC